MSDINYTKKQYISVQKVCRISFHKKYNIILQTYQMSIYSAHNELKSTQFQVYYTTVTCPLHHIFICNFHHFNTLQREFSAI